MRFSNGVGEAYNAAEMSDGERVIFYLIGQCLSAPRDGIIVIDEPELHLHKSLQAALWDAVEAERPDCLFVYITHDLDFALTRVGAPKICVKAFQGGNWDWYIAPENEAIPEDIFLQIVGGRKPVLFVEGSGASLDQFLYSRLYSSHTVVPLESCSHVIHATRSFSSLKRFHTLECAGIVDRDSRSDEAVEHLKGIGIFVCEVNEIENLCLLEEVLKQVGYLLAFDEAEIQERIKQLKALVFRELEREKDKVASAIAATAIESQLTKFDAKAQGGSALKVALSSLVDAIDAEKLYADAHAKIEAILANEDYSAALKIYNNKGLLANGGNAFGLKPHELPQYIKRLLNSEKSEIILNAMRVAVPMLA